MELVPPTATYDESKEAPTENQRALARAIFEFGQAIRREKSAEDPDSPNKLTAQEIFMNVATRAPSLVQNVVDILGDPSNDVTDFTTAAYLVERQLIG